MSSRLRRVLGVGLTTFLVSVSLNFLSKLVLGSLGILLGFFALILIIITGILFDILGTSVTAAKEEPFHAMAAKKVFGAREAIRILRNADRVANFSNDLVGDICGTVSGAIGASLVFFLVVAYPGLKEAYLGAAVVGLVSAVTVGGKAFSKGYAIDEANEVVLLAGKFLAGLERVTGIRLLSEPRNSGSRVPGSRDSREKDRGRK